MGSQQYYGNVIWTNHALERLGERGLSQELAWQAFKNPDRTIKGKEKGTVEYQKRFHKSLVIIIAKQNEKGEWVILSCWIDPPLPGSIDARKKEEYKRYKQASFWGKLLLTLKKQLGF